jgi:antitoxin component HigA of HigAB toxin-antitoxin module
MKTKVIKTESDYAAALERVEKLMDAKPGNAQGDELEVLSLLVHWFTITRKEFFQSTHRTLSPVTSKPASRGRIKTGHSEVIYTYWNS